MGKINSEKFRPPFPTSPFIEVTLYGNGQRRSKVPLFIEVLHL